MNDASSASLQIRRTLRLSATRWNSSDPSTGNNDGTASDPAPAKSKFGSRWGPKQSTPSAGLTFAEQAMRQTLITNSQPPPSAPEPLQRRRELSNRQWNLGESNQQRKPYVRRVGPRENQDAYRASRETPRNQQRNSSIQEKNPFEEEKPGGYPRWPRETPRNQGRNPSTQEKNPFKEESSGSYMRWPKGTARSQERSPSTQEKNPFKEENSGSYMRPKGTSRNQERNPSNRGKKTAFEEENPFAPEKTQNRFQGQLLSRATRDHPMAHKDWNCPQCMKHVFATKQVCPFCKTSRPGDAQPKFRITREYSDSPGSSQFKQFQSPSGHTRKFQQLGDSILSDLEQDTQPSTKETTERHSEESDRPGTKEAFKKNQWSWDMSALEQLENLEAQEQPPPKPMLMKRRDGRKGRETESDGADFDPEDRERLRIERRRQQKEKDAQRAAKKAAALAAPAPLYLPEFISISNLADVIGVRPAQFVQRMEEMGFEEITYRDILDAETAGLVAAEFNYEAIFDSGKEDLYAAPELEDTSDLPSRPPVVTIMGHVDHGKTTILDWLRNSSVAASEHGGITQHIGAFSVMMPSGKAITFLDTPGHSAFLEMRRRGADVTDIVVLVVAADDSVKPQTIEAIKHATQAKVPVIVAISKIDKEGNNPDRVKGDLSVHGIHVEDYGGDVQAIGVSGKTGQGMVELEEAIVALSEMLDHRAATTCNVEGWVIEASTKSYGRVASVLIRRGTLRSGDIVVAGTAWARVRTLRNEAGVTISEATPGMPVEIDGWREQPGAGTELLQAPTEQKAKDVVDYRLEKSDTQKMGVDMVAINEARRELLEKRRREKEEEETTKEVEPTGPKSVNFILKGDVDGSVEAVLNSVAAIGTNEVFANIIRSGVGPVSEFDIEHAGSAKGKIISFNQAIDPNIMRISETEGVEILDHNIIYKLIDDIKAILSEKLPPTVTMRVTGEAEIQQVFEITVKGREKTAIAGSRVRNGIINKTRKVRVLRGEETVYDGTMVSLKNVKKDVTEMRKDTECGIAFENWTDFVPGDHVQCYEEISEKRYL
ncbi:Mitochondrial translation initiation factor, putative [Penicillium digitatum PHI26]|uniref:Translation initiation factor IF-2, mitochondrial n=2 Tax=Penicillium digitatum TaxID=36651 RepID=K9FKJ4_PEND2|nr:Mitochondrial translation initiation factor, putative [Penicillium digitatum Pd1]EKV08256.1 Mitochondrial translation initiation factor, putative [Penicillium digitatum Pd1]EKV09759.1 Mitochondrial translation initiation factor, putative [Penicillium digitatum PHI26]